MVFNFCVIVSLMIIVLFFQYVRYLCEGGVSESYFDKCIDLEVIAFIKVQYLRLATTQKPPSLSLKWHTSSSHKEMWGFSSCILMHGQVTIVRYYLLSWNLALKTNFKVVLFDFVLSLKLLGCSHANRSQKQL